MCLVCRSRELIGKRRTSLNEEKKGSKELVNPMLIRLSFVDGTLHADIGDTAFLAEKRVGRGAYVHNAAQCLAQLAKRGRLEQALRITSKSISGKNSEVSSSDSKYGLKYGSFAAQVKQLVSTLLQGAVNS